MAGPQDSPARAAAPGEGPAVGAVREAIGIFHDAGAMEAAVKELESSGFDRADISLLARADAVQRRLGGQRPQELADDPAAPRKPFVPPEAEEQGTAMLGGMLGSIGGMAAAGAVVATGGALAAVIGAAALAAGAGGLIGTAGAKYLGEQNAKQLDDHLEKGGLLTWVRVIDEERERKATSILTKHGATDVHVHTFGPR